MNVSEFLPILQTLLAIGNLAIMLYALSKFLTKPHDTLEQRVIALEVKVKDHDQALHQGNDRFRDQDTTNETLINSTLALIEFEMQYCLTEKKPMSDGLKDASDKLHKFLAKRRGGHYESD